MCYIVTEVKKVKLIKIKGEWFVSYVVNSSDDSKSIKYVNYPPTPKAMGWASGVIDSPNGNASSRFCLT